jgi:hypothetical protein
MWHRHDDFIIAEARFLGMIPLLSGAPLTNADARPARARLGRFSARQGGWFTHS